MPRSLSYIHPKKVRDYYSTLLICSNISTNIDDFLSAKLLTEIIISVLISINLDLILEFGYLAGFVVSFVLAESLIFSVLYFKAEGKARAVEGSLPDALQLMAANLRAGLTLDKSLLSAARPEFGPLKQELDTVGKEVTLGKDISNSLKNMTHRIKSEKVDKVIGLILSGIKSGGKIADLLDNTASNYKKQEFIEKKIQASILMYIIFIFAAIGVGSPMLFASSSFLVETLSSAFTSLEITETTMIPNIISGSEIDTSMIIYYIVISLVVTSITGSLILGQIGKNKAREGIKYMPLLIIMTLTIFFVMRAVLSSMLGGLFS